MRTLLATVLLLTLTGSAAWAQIVNVLPDASRDAQGFDLSLTGALDRRTGATQILLLSGGVRTSYRNGGRLLLGIAEGEFGEKSGDRFASRQFEHVRYRASLLGVVSAEAFVQHESNEFRRLASRTLLGVGLRAETPLGDDGTAALGSAYMREREQLRDGDEEDAGEVDALHRWSNYLSLEWRASDIATVSHTTFAQPRLDDFADLRVLSELELALAVTERVRVRLSFTLTHDSRPPTDVNTTDTRTKTALTVKF
jgi:hypothetical protein